MACSILSLIGIWKKHFVWNRSQPQWRSLPPPPRRSVVFASVFALAVIAIITALVALVFIIIINFIPFPNPLFQALEAAAACAASGERRSPQTPLRRSPLSRLRYYLRCCWRGCRQPRKTAALQPDQKVGTLACLQFCASEQHATLQPPIRPVLYAPSRSADKGALCSVAHTISKS